MHNNIYSQLKLTKSEIRARPNSMRLVQPAEQNSSRSSVTTWSTTGSRAKRETVNV